MIAWSECEFGAIPEKGSKRVLITARLELFRNGGEYILIIGGNKALGSLLPPQLKQFSSAQELYEYITDSISGICEDDLMPVKGVRLIDIIDDQTIRAEIVRMFRILWAEAVKNDAKCRKANVVTGV